MNSRFIFGFVLFALFLSDAQNLFGQFDKKGLSENKLNVESFGYPNFLDGEAHSNFIIGYEFDKEFLFELQGFYDTYRLYDVFDLRVLGKAYLSNNFYLFSGIGVEEEIDKHGFKPPPPRVKLLNGFGYDVDKKFSLEARHDLHFNKTNFGNYGTPNLFSLSGKYKF